MDKTQTRDSGRSPHPRVCLFSQRNLQKLVSRCAEFEFEDIISEIDDVELLAPKPRFSFVIGQKVSNRLSRHITISSVNPGVRKLRVDRKFDIFVAVIENLGDLPSLNAIKGWKRHCRVSVCWLPEAWPGELHNHKGHLRILSKFDYVMLNCSASVGLVQDVISSSCCHMPPGIDTIRFCPYPNPPLRSIDVYSMGRKSSITHQALLKMVEQRQIFYIYDTFEGMKTFLPRDHRILVANIAKRSRYFVANAPKINRQSETHGQSGLSYRFLEGAASGTVMIGEPRQNEELKKHLDWPDAVINVPYNTVDIAEILADLDSQPERLEKIRMNSVVQCLLRHDWVYRWRAILNIVGLEPMPALVEREKRLKELAEDIRKTC